MIKVEDYKRWVSDHLPKTADLVIRPKVMALFEDKNLLLETVNMELSVKEEEFVRQPLAPRAILSPKLLIKDHKKINKKWVITNKVGNTRNKLYRDILQDRISWDKEVPGQGKSELFTRF